MRLGVLGDRLGLVSLLDVAEESILCPLGINLVSAVLAFGEVCLDPRLVWRRQGIGQEGF